MLDPLYRSIYLYDTTTPKCQCPPPGGVFHRRIGAGWKYPIRTNRHTLKAVLHPPYRTGAVNSARLRYRLPLRLSPSPLLIHSQ